MKTKPSPSYSDTRADIPIDQRIDQRINDAINNASHILPQVDREQRLEAEILLAHCLDKSRTYLRTWPERTISADQQSQFEKLIARRQAGEPIAYLTGQREFWDISLKVSEATLIPRAETEHLVELALDLIPESARWQIADLGTGSGAVALAIAKHRPNCQITAIDSSTSALQIARENGCTLDLKNVVFQQSSWFEGLAGQTFNLIVSNPPYVAENDPHLSKGDLRYEPRTALTSGPTGLDDLTTIIQQSPHYLATTGWLLVEHGYQQGPEAIALFSAAGFDHIDCHLDSGQRQRVTKGQIVQI